jgi:hypothetical protein
MGVVAVFNYSKWIGRYPEFKSVSAEMAQGYFDEAGIYLRNDGSGPVGDATTQLVLMNMITAHIAQLNATINGVAPSPLVGRIASAGEGSVNVSTEYAAPGTAAWFSQTKYGANFWQASAAYRTMRYSPLPTVVADGIFPFVPTRQ